MAELKNSEVKEALQNLIDVMKLSNEMPDKPSYRFRINIDEIPIDSSVEGVTRLQTFDCPPGEKPVRNELTGEIDCVPE